MHLPPGTLHRAFVALAAAVAIGGCGGEPTPSPPATAPTVDRPAPQTSPGQTAPRDSGDPAQQGRGRSGNSPREAEADFQKYCETHPDACAD